MPKSLRRSLYTFVPASLAALLLVGCSASPPPRSDLQLTSIASGAPFTQAFPVGVADAQDAGDTDLVFACQTPAAAAGGQAVRQVLHVRVLWKQGHNIKSAMQAVSQNATFHWSVAPAGQPDAAARPAVVEYRGTGLVELTRDGDQVSVAIRSATLTPATVAGGMTDPLGPTTLSGTVVARLDARETAVALNDLRATVAAARPVPANRTAEANLPLGQ